MTTRDCKTDLTRAPTTKSGPSKTPYSQWPDLQSCTIRPAREWAAENVRPSRQIAPRHSIVRQPFSEPGTGLIVHLCLYSFSMWSRDETNEGDSAPAVISPSKIFWQSRESAHHTFKNEKCVASLVACNYHIFVQHFRHENTVPSLNGCPKLTPRPFGHDKFNLGGRRQQRINTYNKHFPLWWNQHCRIIGRQTLNTPAT